MYVCNVGIMFVCSSDQGITVIPTVKSFIKLINQIKSNWIKLMTSLYPESSVHEKVGIFYPFSW